MSCLSLIAIPVLIVAGPAIAGPAEPALVETKLPDPDPGFVPPPPEKRLAHRSHNSEENPTLDEAMENLGRVIGQAAQVAEQRAGKRADANRDELTRMACRSVESARSSGVDVSAWDKKCPH